MMRKQIALMVVVAMFVSLLMCPGVRAAYSGTCGPDITWTLDDDGCLEIKGSGDMPDYNYGNGVYSPWYEAGLSGRIKSVKISEGITSIGDWAFVTCSMTSIAFPSTLVRISGNTTFQGCNDLNSIYISDLSAWCKVDIGYHPFSGGSDAKSRHLFLNNVEVKDLVIPGDVTTIGGGAFYGLNGLTSVTIPNSVTTICGFDGCTSLTSVTIPNSVTTIGGFSDCTSLTSVKIPESVMTINRGAFRGCTSLTSVSIGNSVTSIGENAFASCKKLLMIELPGSLTEIGKGAFSGVTYPMIKVNAQTPPTLYENLPMSMAIVPNASISAYKSAEYWKNMTITSPERSEIEVTMTGEMALSEAIIRQAKIAPASVTKIRVHGPLTDDDVKTTLGINMRNCYSIDVSDTNVESLPDETFSKRTVLMSVILPECLKYVGARAFSGCSSLNNIELPKAIETIGNSAFYGCVSLRQINLPDGLTSLGKGVFEGCIDMKQVDMSCLALTEVPGSTFWNCSSLEDVKLPYATETIGNYAFYGCGKLHDIDYVSTIKTIGMRTFGECTSLKTLDLFKCVELTGIGEGAFRGCSSLKTINLPTSITTIGTDAFNECREVSIINSPAEVPPTIGSDGTLYGINKDVCVLSIPNDKYFDYFRAPYWGQFVEFTSSVIVSMDENGGMTYAVNNVPFATTSQAKAMSQTSSDDADINAVAYNTANICVKENMSVTFKIKPNEGYKIESVKYAGKDVTSQVVDGIFTTPIVNGDTDFAVSFVINGVDDIAVDGADDADTLYDVYNIQGMKVGSGLHRDEMTDALPRGIYILVSPNGTRKVKI